MWRRVQAVARGASANPDRSVAIAIGAASAVRLGYAVALGNRIGGPDGVVYHEMARGFSEVGVLAEGVPFQPFWPPLYPLLLGMVYEVVGPHPVAVKLLQVAGIALMTWLSYLVARRVFGHPVAVLTGLGLSVSPAWLTLGHPFMYEPLLAVLLIAGIWLALGDRPVWAGLAFGAAALTNNKLLPFIAVAAAVYWWRARRWRTTALLLVAALLPVGAWVGRMQAVYGEPIPIRSYNGFNLVIAHNDGANGGHVASSAIRVPGDCAGLDPTPPDRFNEHDRRFTRCALRWASDHPARELSLMKTRLFRFLGPYIGPWKRLSTWFPPYDPREALPASVAGSAWFLTTDRWLTGAYFAAWLALLGWGFVRAWRVPGGGLVLWVVGFFVVTQIATHGDARYRLPIAPQIAMLQAVAAVDLWRRWRSLRPVEEEAE